MRCALLFRFSLFLSLLAVLTTPVPAVSLNGVDYVDLREVAGTFGMKSKWLEKGTSVRLESEWTRMDFTEHRRDCLINGIKVHLGNPIYKRGGNLYLSQRDLENTLKPILTPQVFNPVPKLYRIVLDPGHGGKDPGARNAGLKLEERYLALDLAKRLKRILQSLGYEVILTREDDRFLGLSERAARANRLKADLFLSLHFNAAGSSRVSGVETFVFTPPFQPSSSRANLHSSDRRVYPGNKYNAWNTLLGYYVQKSLVDASPYPDRGLKRARFTVLRDIEIPGILIEGGFVSHSREGRDVGSPAYRQKLARAIANGVLTYQKTLNRLREK